jgi:hypothetical protein
VAATSRAARPVRGSRRGPGPVRRACDRAGPSMVNHGHLTAQNPAGQRPDHDEQSGSKLMTPRSSLRPPHVLRVPRDQLRDNPAGHGHRATNAHGHCQRAHLHIPAGTVITPVASGRRDRHRPGSRLRNRDVCSPPRCLVGSCTPNLPFRDQAASRGSMGRLADGGRRVRPARGAAGSGVARSRR